MSDIFFKEERKPDLKLGGFELWVHGRQFPDAEDYYDGNWLMVNAQCVSDTAMVQAIGPFIHLPELHHLLRECKQIYQHLSGRAQLMCMEPNLKLVLKMQSRGHCEFTVSITPDHLSQEHKFKFDVDQSHILVFLQELEALLKQYPLIGSKN